MNLSNVSHFPNVPSNLLFVATPDLDLPICCHRQIIFDFLIRFFSKAAGVQGSKITPTAKKFIRSKWQTVVVLIMLLQRCQSKHPRYPQKGFKKNRVPGPEDFTPRKFNV